MKTCSITMIFLLGCAPSLRPSQEEGVDMADSVADMAKPRSVDCDNMLWSHLEGAANQQRIWLCYDTIDCEEITPEKCRREGGRFNGYGAKFDFRRDELACSLQYAEVVTGDNTVYTCDERSALRAMPISESGNTIRLQLYCYMNPIQPTWSVMCWSDRPE